MRKFSRREFIALVAASGGVAVAGGIVYNLNAARQTVPPLGEPNSTPSTASLTASSLPVPLWLTANPEFYTVKYAQVPQIGLDSWSLSVTGLVHEPIRLTYAEVKTLPVVTTMHTLECIGNPAGGNLIGNAEWRGISLRDLLQRAGVDARARYAVIGGVDEYFTSVPIERAMHEHSLLAYEMNGETLPLNHGFPLRALLPGVYGQKQPKWITGIDLTDREELGPWEQQGWSREAILQLNSAIRQPVDNQKLKPGDILIAGVAHHREIGIQSIEVSTDGGATWNAATLTRGPSPYVWTTWGYVFKNASPGQHRLMVRAIDRDGNRQDQVNAGILTDVFPNGTSAVHSIIIDVST